MVNLKEILSKIDQINPMSVKVPMLVKELKKALSEIDINSITFKNK